MVDSLSSMEYNFARNVEGPSAVDVQLQKQIDSELSESVDREIAETKRKIREIKSSQRSESFGKIKRGVRPVLGKVESFLGSRASSAKKLSKAAKKPTIVVQPQRPLLEPMQRDRSRFFNTSYEAERRQLFFK